jgi:hypothetical protein
VVHGGDLARRGAAAGGVTAFDHEVAKDSGRMRRAGGVPYWATPRDDLGRRLRYHQLIAPGRQLVIPVAASLHRKRYVEHLLLPFHAERDWVNSMVHVTNGRHRKGRSGVAVILGVMTLFSAAAIGVLSFVMTSSRPDPITTASIEKCRKMDIDVATGQARDRGLVPCSNLEIENSRQQLIRDGFVRH